MSSDQYHPEFGYLSPSPQFRRVLRVGLLAGALGTAAGILVALAVVGRPGTELARSPTSVGVTPAGQPAARTEEVGSAPTATSAQQTAQERLSQERLSQDRLTEDPPKPGQAPSQPAPQPSGQDQAVQNRQDAAEPSQAVTDTAAQARPDQTARAPSQLERSAQAPAPASSAASQPGPDSDGGAHAATTGLATRPSSADAGRPCKESTWPYFDNNCLWGKTKRHVRVAVPERAESAGHAERQPQSAARSGTGPIRATQPTGAPTPASSSASSETGADSGRKSRQAGPAKRQSTAQSSRRKSGRERGEVDIRRAGRDDDAYDARADARSERDDPRFAPRDEPRIVIRREEPRYESHDSFFPFPFFGGGGRGDW